MLRITKFLIKQKEISNYFTRKLVEDHYKEEIRRIVYLTLKAVGENATDCKIDGVMKYIEENM